jgi:hypothetical protein
MEQSHSWEANSRLANQEIFATQFFTDSFGFEFLTLVTMKSKVVWYVTPCISVEVEV